MAPSVRSCGDCRLCCKVLRLRSEPDDPRGFDKPMGEWCRQACASGCSIYAERPVPCVRFECAWLEGQLRDGDRPDRSKVIVNVEGDEEIGRVWCVYESWPDVHRSGRAREIVEALLESGRPVCIVPGPDAERKLIVRNHANGPELLRRIRDRGR